MVDFSLLSRFDDFLASVFLDGVYLWFATKKMNADCQGVVVPTKTIVDIIKKHVSKPKPDMKALVADLLEWIETSCPGNTVDIIKKYLAARDKKECAAFVQHMERYLQMYMPNAGYEVSDTRRYTGASEACIIATKDWAQGEKLKTCPGMIATLNPEEEARLRNSDLDFSIMYSTRKKMPCLFLGPARFMNHDCDANTSFVAGATHVTFVVKKKIKCGEEITTFYGKHYFGENNCECRCATCEKEGKGYYEKFREKNKEKEEAEASGPRRSGRRRRQQAESYEHYFPKCNSKPKSKKRALEAVEEAVTDSSGAIPETSSDAEKHQLEGDEDDISTEAERTRKRRRVMSIDFLCGTMNKHDDSSAASNVRSQPLPHCKESLCDAFFLLCDAANDVNYIHSDGQSTFTVDPSAAAQISSIPKAPQPPPCGQYKYLPSSRQYVPISPMPLSMYPWPPPMYIQQHPYHLPMVHTPYYQLPYPSAQLPPMIPPQGRSVQSPNPIYRNEPAQEKSLSSTIPSSSKWEQQIPERCIACAKSLKDNPEEWFNNPSVASGAWPPQRCARCERHLLIFALEWPQRSANERD